jgi:hypothetical protein
VPANVTHGRARDRKGCRCDLCKYAESEYQRRRRQRTNKSVGVFAARDTPSLVLLHGTGDSALTRGNADPTPANAVLDAVTAEIDALGNHLRPGLAAAAKSMAVILDNNKAVSTQPAAAKVLVALLDKLRSVSASGRRGNLASVRALTKKGGAW